MKALKFEEDQNKKRRENTNVQNWRERKRVATPRKIHPTVVSMAPLICTLTSGSLAIK
uniref:Uncharacterized protein n=1 Tax=Anguilla anguilla TaxID=7936 RepID=A0A0E9WWR4_ANGAN